MSDAEKTISGSSNHDKDNNKFLAQANNKTATPSAVEQTTAAYHSKETESSAQHLHRRSSCLSRSLKIIFSTPGLVLLVVLYSVLGALIFPLLEAPQDITKSAAIAKSREDCLRELWIITASATWLLSGVLAEDCLIKFSVVVGLLLIPATTHGASYTSAFLWQLYVWQEKLNVLYERNWTMLVHEQLRRFEGSIVAATRSGGPGGLTPYGGRSNTGVGRFGGSLDAYDSNTARWSFSEALLYSVTVITTIGHGSLTPKTAAGKIATILYALIGVPLMLMCLSSLGALLAEGLQCTYARICCHLARHHGHGHSHQRQHPAHQQHQHQQQQQQERRRQNTGGRGNKRQRRCSADSLDEGSDVAMKTRDNECAECQGKAHALDCKSCKYDAINTETNLKNGYHYGDSSRGPAIEQSEDSCQLLHSSPAKLNHNSPCMQLKMAAGPPTTMASVNAAYYQRNSMGGCQQQQPRPDVMLMTTGQKLSQHQGPPQQQKLQQCTRSATPSPQHFQHPLQTFHIVSSASASTSSSPTHQTFVRQYATLQPHQHQQGHLHQQHYVAVPTMVRFQTSEASNDGSGSATAPTNNMPPNCYQPGAEGATIFIPIATSAMSTPATVAPLVKYHTIQLQHKKSYGGDDGSGNHQQLAMDPNLPLPPPPAYQTATVHGVRRAKFITKPLPQEINALLAETSAGMGGASCGSVADMSPRHDLLTQHPSQAAAQPAVTLTGSAVMSSTGMATATTTATTSPMTMHTTNVQSNYSQGGSTSGGVTEATNAMGMGSNGTVDIMEDEEENEQQRIGNCPHGTPSRVPLISAGGQNRSNHVNATHDFGGSTKELEKSAARSLINATAASFHRHTLNTFQRSNSLHQRGTRRHIAPSSRCYGDNAETSDDDDAYMQHCTASSEQFVLEPLDSTADNTDDDLDSNHDGLSDGPQVPISIVLLILICYISVGTVIFAFWENWSFIDGAYFCFVTLATIGYGDFLPERTFQGPEVQLFACCAYLLLGLVLVAMSFSILETQLMWKCKRIAVRLKLAKD